MNFAMGSLKQWRWRHWAAAALVLLYLTYLALSYLYLPGKLKHILEHDVARTLGRDIHVRRVAFNPFTLALTVEQFAIADRPQRPLVSWQRFFVNFDAWGSLFGWKVRLSAVQLDAPHISVERRRQGYNFSDILTRLAKPRSGPPRKKTPLALQIDHIGIRGGRLRIDDLSGTRPAHSVIDNVTLNLTNLYLATGDQRLNPLSLRAVLPGGGRLSLNGSYRASPLRLDARVSAVDVRLKPFSAFVRNRLPIGLGNGRLSLHTALNIAMDKTLHIQTHRGELTLRDLALNDDTAAPPLLRCNLIDLRGIDMDLERRQLAVDAIAVDGLNTHQWLDAQGRPRVAPLLAGGEPSTPEPAPPPAHPWTVTVGKTVLRNGGVSFTDHRQGMDATQRIRDLSVTLGELRLKQGPPVPLQVSATVNDGGTVNADGRITLAPFSLDLRYRGNKLALAPFSPYVESLSRLKLRRGALKVDGTISLTAARSMPVDLTLNAGIDDLQTTDTRTGKPLLQWKTLDVTGLHLDLPRRRLAVERIQLDTPAVTAHLGPDRKLNLATLMKAPPAGRKATPAAGGNKGGASPWRISLGKLALRRGRVQFGDASVKPAFHAGLYSIDLDLERLTSAGKQPGRFSLSAKVDRYAPFTVKGTLAPLNRQPGFAFTSQLQGLEMPSLSPYTGTYIGYNLGRGRLTLHLKYRLAKRMLEGSNNIVAKQLYLGEKVPSDKAVHIPVALGLALLRDASGVIDLDMGVSGKLDDPSFSVSGIVFKALMNIIVKAAASPFKLLASLVGGSGGEDLGAVEFTAGDGALDEANRQKLRQLTKALAKRPQLAVTVQGCADPSADRAALQMKHLITQLAARRKVPETDLQPATLLNVKANRSALRDINAALKLPGLSKREDAVGAAHPDMKGDARTQEAYRNMLRDVVAGQTVTDVDLLTLSDQRALSIKQFLVEKAGLGHDRIQLEKARKEDLKGRTCSLGLQPR